MSFKKEAIMSLSAQIRSIILITCASVLWWPAGSLLAQEPESTLLQLSAKDEMAFEVMVAEIELQQQDLVAIDERLGTMEGPAADILTARRDKVWTSMFDNTIKFALAVADQQDKGVDVAEFMDELTDDFSVLPAEAYEATERIRTRVTFPTSELPPNEFVVKDQQLFQGIEELDAINKALIAYTQIAERFDLDNSTEVEYLIEVLADSAANRSVFLETAISDVKMLRSAVATLPDDTDLAAWHAAAKTRVAMSAASLQNAIDLMILMGLETRQYRQQVLTVTGEITTDILDVGIAANLVSEWSRALWDLTASEGPRLIFRLLLVAVILLVFHQLAKLVQKGVERAMNSSRNRMSYLLRRMVSSSIRNLVMIFGVLIGISQLGISLAPLLAGLGIAGFIIGFALQDSLSNFASGVMILMYRPFDVGDVVDAAGVRGRVNHMSLVNTTFMTLDNQRLIVPNNMIWQSVITNVTAQRTRRVDLLFGISYSDDIEKAERVLMDILEKHESVLDDPEPVVRVHELGESSVNFAVRPWVKTSDYWETFWDLTREVKLRFDKEGISIPFPQRDVHVKEQKLA
jgi:small conductance mechanosensitive channel